MFTLGLSVAMASRLPKRISHAVCCTCRSKLLLRATGNHDQAQVCQTSVLLGRLCWHASVVTGQAFPASAYRKDAHRCVKASHTLQSVQQYSSAQDLVLINQLTVITLCTALLSLCLSRVTMLPCHDYE